MEWRVFLPVLQKSDRWVCVEEESQYNAAIERLRPSDRQWGETRTDTYILSTCDRVGIKERAGKRLEVKVRDRTSLILPGAEEWTKEKFGKSGFDAYKSDIGNMLSSRGMDDCKQLLSEDRVVNVIKFRSRVISKGRKRETTTIELDCDANICGGDRKWVSLCFESTTEEDLLEFIRSFDQSALLSALDLCLSIRLSHSTEAEKAGFVPVLSGYPAWLHCLAYPSHSRSPDILSPIFEFFDMMDYSSSCRSLAESLNCPTHPPTCGHAPRLVIVRGPGAVGMFGICRSLQELLVRKGFNVAYLEQEYFVSTVLHENSNADTLAAEIIRACARTALDAGSTVIMGGSFNSQQYGDMINGLIGLQSADRVHLFYVDILLNETKDRQSLQAITCVSEEDTLKGWAASSEGTPVECEICIPSSFSVEQSVSLIYDCVSHA